MCNSQSPSLLMIAAITSNYYQYGCMYHFDLLAVGGQIGQHQTYVTAPKRGEQTIVLSL
jgi:hypothetical protein